MILTNINPTNTQNTQIITALNEIQKSCIKLNLYNLQVTTSDTLIYTNLQTIKGYIVVRASTQVQIWDSPVQPKDPSILSIRGSTTANITLLVF
jgi:hypothetical protein